MTLKPVMLAALLLVVSSAGLIAQDKNNEGQPGLSIHEEYNEIREFYAQVVKKQA